MGRSQTLTDNFNRTAANPDTSYYLKVGADATFYNQKCTGTVAQSSSSGGTTIVHAITSRHSTPVTGDVYSEANIAWNTGATPWGPSVAVRVRKNSDAGVAYCYFPNVYCNQGVEEWLQAYMRYAGSWVSVGSAVTVDLTAAGDLLGIAVEGTSLGVFLESVEVMGPNTTARTDSTITAAMSPEVGFSCTGYNYGSTVDNLDVGNFSWSDVTGSPWYAFAQM